MADQGKPRRSLLDDYLPPSIHEITTDHAGWLREHMARQMETEASFEEMAARRDETVNPARAAAHRLRAKVWRQMANEVRPKPLDDEGRLRMWFARLTRKRNTAHRSVVLRGTPTSEVDMT